MRFSATQPGLREGDFMEIFEKKLPKVRLVLQLVYVVVLIVRIACELWNMAGNYSRVLSKMVVEVRN